MKQYTTPKGGTWTHGEKLYGHNEWHSYLGPCPECGSRTFNYGGGWRCVETYCQNSPNNDAPNVGPSPDWWNTNIVIEMDGNMWCAHYDDFTNLMESPAGFGETPQKSVEELLNAVHEVKVCDARKAQ
jgi:hypothetical protein